MDGALYLVADGGSGGSASSASGTGGAGGNGGSVGLSSASTLLLRGLLVSAGGGQGGYAGDGTTQAAAGTLGQFSALATSVDVDDVFYLIADWTNNSVVNLRGSGAVVAAGLLRNAGEINLYDSGMLFAADVNNVGTLRAFGSAVSANVSQNTGLVEVNAGSTLYAPQFLSNAGTVVVNGTLQIGENAGAPVPPVPPSLVLSASPASGTTFSNLASGVIAGNGTIAVDSGGGTVDNFGTIAPGGAGAVGTLAINGNLVMESSAVLAADLVNAGNYDTLVVSGSATSGGKVAVTYQPDTIFLQGQSFAVLQSGALSAGTLPAVDKPELGAAANGNNLLLVARSDFPSGVSPIVQSAALQGVSQIVTFADLFVKMAQDQDPKRIGKDDIVVTDTACTR
jgi:hypothetical protein